MEQGSAAAAVGKISVTCGSCGARLLAPASSAGTRAKCPRCKKELIVASSQPPAPLAASRIATPPSPSSQATTHVQVLEEEPRRAGSMWLGALLSAIAAALGAGAWLAIAWYTGSELSLIAWAVGMASGVGMLLGRHRAGRGAGLVAALLAACGVLAGKVLVFLYVKAPLLIVLALLTQQQLESAGVDPAQATSPQRLDASDKAQATIRSMDAAARRAQIRTIVAARATSGGVLAGLSARQRVRLFFRTMFAPIDFIVIVLAVGSAFKIGTLGGAGGA